MVIKSKRNISKKTLLILAIASVMIILSFLSFVLYPRIIDKKIIPLKVEVGEVLGLNAEDSILNFGILIPGQASTKKIILSNTYASEVEVRISLDKGNITKFIYGDSKLILSPNESKEYAIMLVIPVDIEQGTYEGNLIVEFLK